MLDNSHTVTFPYLLSTNNFGWNRKGPSGRWSSGITSSSSVRTWCEATRSSSAKEYITTCPLLSATAHSRVSEVSWTDWMAHSSGSTGRLCETIQPAERIRHTDIVRPIIGAGYAYGKGESEDPMSSCGLTSIKRIVKLSWWVTKRRWAWYYAVISSCLGSFEQGQTLVHRKSLFWPSLP